MSGAGGGDSNSLFNFLISVININIFENFSFNGVRMRTCYARPEIVYILSREDRLILRKESMGKFIFFPGGVSVSSLVILSLFIDKFHVAFLFSLKIKNL